MADSPRRTWLVPALAVAALAALLALRARAPARALACPPTPPSYRAEVEPLLRAHCLSCHRSGAVAANTPLTSREELLAKRMIVQAVVASGKMPPANAPALSEPDAQTLLAYLACGAPDT